MAEFDVMDHFLVPKHIVLSANEVEKVLEKYNSKRDQLPKILITDPCVKVIGAKVGDIIRIERESPTSGVSIAYRIVVDVVK